MLIVWRQARLLDPLRQLTESAERIGQGDFTAAHQTLRDDEIGVLFNSFATMALAVQTPRARAGHGAQRIARDGGGDGRIAAPRRGRARRPAGDARNRAGRADDLQPRWQRAPAQPRRHRRLRHRAAGRRAARRTTGAASSASPRTARSIPPEQWISDARPARRAGGQPGTRDPPSRRPRVPDPGQRRAAAQRARPRHRRGGRLRGHLAAARSRSDEGRVRLDRQPRAAHAAHLDPRIGAAGARRCRTRCPTPSTGSCCRSR